jgi:transposase-like protein
MSGRQSAAVASAVRRYWKERKVYKHRAESVKHIAKRFGIDASSLYRAIKNGKGKRND